MPNKQRRRTNNNNKNKNKKKANNNRFHEEISIVGPEYFQLLQGELFGKQVALVLCGESHYDSIDVTRTGGRFSPRFGWVDVTPTTSVVNEWINFLKNQQKHNSDNKQQNTTKQTPTYVQTACRILKQSKKLMPLAKAQEWGKEQVEDGQVFPSDLLDGDIVLVWIEDTSHHQKGSPRGKSYLLEVVPEEDLFHQLEDDSDSEEDSAAAAEEEPTIKIEHWLTSNSTLDQKQQYPIEIQNWIFFRNHDYHQKEDDDPTTTPLVLPKLYEWGDLDSEAYEMNKRRLTTETISVREMDDLINKRKDERKQRQKIWTFDDWFYHIRGSTTGSTDNDNVDVHLMLEGSVPPWEVEMHRPPRTEEELQLQLPTAADCFRCVSEDSDESTTNEKDASNDGIGSYLDYIYRRFMKQMIQEQSTKEVVVKSTWLHCIDARDLGCEEACHADEVKVKWKDLLTPKEWDDAMNDVAVDAAASGTMPDDDDADNPDTNNTNKTSQDDVLHFRTQTSLNSEQKLYQEMKESGKLLPADSDDSDDDSDSDDDDSANLEFTYPSFESFFGQNTDILYYSPHVKVSFTPFLALVVRSMSNWEKFFTNLFFEGTIENALSYLDLHHHQPQQHGDDPRENLYIRSPILKEWDAQSNTYIWKERDSWLDEYITVPFLPYVFHLKAKGSNPPRTWSSQLYANLIMCSSSNNDNSPLLSSSSQQQQQQQQHAREKVEFAKSVLQWTLGIIQRISKDPKGNDDPEFGGEWFVQYLRTVHRDVYDDIDHTDPTELLKRNQIASESHDGFTHAIGKINMPSCEAAFEEIINHFNNNNNNNNTQEEAKIDDDDDGEEEDSPTDAATTTTTTTKSTSGTTSLTMTTTTTARASAPPNRQIINSRTEVLAKILIDIWVHQLVDYCSVLKIGNIIAANHNDDDENDNSSNSNSNSRKVVVVAYLGLAHTRAVADFFCTRANFQKRGFFGKANWGDDESRKIHLPSKLWNLSELF